MGGFLDSSVPAGLGLTGLCLTASCGGAGAPRSAQADTAVPGPVLDTRAQEQLEVNV